MLSTDLLPIDFTYQDGKNRIFRFTAERMVIPYFCGASLVFNHHASWLEDKPAPEEQFDIYSYLYSEIIDTALRDDEVMEEDYDEEEEPDYRTLGPNEDVPEIVFTSQHHEFHRILRCLGFEQFSPWVNGNSGNSVTGFKIGLNVDLEEQRLPFDDPAWGRRIGEAYV